MILVTGVTGFVGGALVRQLAELRTCNGLVVTARFKTEWPEGVHQVQVGDLRSISDWSIALQGVNTVIHCAARAHVMNDAASDPLAEYRRVNVQGTLTLARQAVAAGVRRFILLSSIKVNGEFTEIDRPFTTDDVPAPEDAYGKSKHEAEQGLIALVRETGMEVVIIRSPLVYGPKVKGNFASMVRWIRKGMPLPLGAVHNKRSLIALENLVDFIALCADPERSPRAANEVFLIADGEDISTTELLHKVATAYHVMPRLLPIPENWIRAIMCLIGKGVVADRLLGSLLVDSSKARELLGWRPVVSMDQQLQKMALHDSHT